MAVIDGSNMCADMVVLCVLGRILEKSAPVPKNEDFGAMHGLYACIDFHYATLLGRNKEYHGIDNSRQHKAIVVCSESTTRRKERHQLSSSAVCK